MIAEPIKRLTPRGVGIVTAAGLVIGDAGYYPLSATPKHTVLYAHSHRAMWNLVRQGKGKARFWRNRYTKYHIGGQPINSARDLFAGMEPEEAYESLRAVRDWVELSGANMSSLGGTANSLWRASLQSRIIVASGRTPVPSEHLALGGRQEAFPDVYEDAALWDMRAAYVSAMKDLFVGARYRRYTRAGGFELRTPSAVGFARATVTRPYGKRRSWGFLPVKNTMGRTVFPREREVEGMFDLQELRAAHKLGCNVVMHEAWIAHGLRLPWRRWAEMIEEGRALPGNAGVMVKAISNTLWGTFATRGKGTWVHYENGRPVSVPDVREFNSPARAVAAHVASYLRARLLLEALYLNDAAAVSAHTDGVILLPGGHPIRRVGDDIGDWSMTTSVRNLTLLSPSMYSYLDSAGDKKYVIAGTPKQYRAKVFSQMIRRIPTNVNSKLVEQWNA